MQQLNIVVVGGVNVDVSGTTETRMMHGDSNPGHVKVTLGGVGRNIAENLARLGAQVSMLTVLGEDANAVHARQECAVMGINLKHAKIVPGGRTSTYLCLNDMDGEIYAAVSDMSICEHITPEYLAQHIDLLNAADVVVVDANIPESSIRWLAENCKAPMAADPVSVKKAGKLQACLGSFVTLKPNRPEASLLTGVAIEGTMGLEEAGQKMLREGVEKVFISLGGQGVYYTDGTTAGIQPCCPAHIVNTTGCGDAFIAAAVIAYAMGKDIRTMAHMGQAASAICAEAESAVSPTVTLEQVLNLMKQTEE